MSNESRRGFLGRLLRSEPERNNTEENESDGNPNLGKTSGELIDDVIQTLEREGVDDKLPDETIRALTANYKKRKGNARKSAGDKTRETSSPTTEEAPKTRDTGGRASWRPVSANPFENGRPNVRAVELAEKLRQEEEAARGDHD